MNEDLKTTRPKLAAPWIYFVATFVWTWLIWGVAILIGATMETATAL